MAETTDVTVTYTAYTKVNVDDNVDLLIYNPKVQKVGGKQVSGETMRVHIGSSLPAVDTQAYFELQPDEGYEKNADQIADVWVRSVSRENLKFVLTE